MRAAAAVALLGTPPSGSPNTSPSTRAVLPSGCTAHPRSRRPESTWKAKAEAVSTGCGNPPSPNASASSRGAPLLGRSRQPVASGSPLAEIAATERTLRVGVPMTRRIPQKYPVTGHNCPPSAAPGPAHAARQLTTACGDRAPRTGAHPARPHLSFEFLGRTHGLSR